MDYNSGNLKIQTPQTIILEYQIIENLVFKSIVRIRDSPHGLDRVLKSLRLFFKNEMKSFKNTDDPNMSRSRRQVRLARQQDIIEHFKIEIERFLYSMQDANSILQQCNNEKAYFYGKFLRYLQRTEESLTTQKEKLCQRFTGFAKNVIDNLYDEKKSDLNSTHNKIVYKLQKNSKLIICANRIPSLDDISEIYDHLSEIIILFNSLQLLDILCNMKISKMSENDFKLYKTHIKNLSVTIQISFERMRIWNFKSDIILMLLFQTLKTLRSFLNIRIVFKMKKESFINIDEDSSNNNNSNKNVSSSPSKFINRKQLNMEILYDTFKWTNNYSDNILAMDLILWIKTIIMSSSGKYNSQDLFTIYGDPKINFDSDSNFDQIFKSIINEIPHFLYIGCPLPCNLIYSSLYLIEILSVNSYNNPVIYNARDEPVSTIFGTLAHELTLSALALSEIRIRKYSLALGGHHSGAMTGAAIGDTSFYRAADDEAVGCLSIATTSFAHNLPETLALQVIHLGYDMMSHRTNSFFLVLAWMKSVSAASLCCLNKQEYVGESVLEKLGKNVQEKVMKKSVHVDKEVTKKVLFADVDSMLPSTAGNKERNHNSDKVERFLPYKLAKKKDISRTLGHMTMRVMSLLCLYRQSLSLSHLGMLIIRTLMRDLFLRPHTMEDMCSKHLLGMLLPLGMETTEKKSAEDEKADEEYELMMSRSTLTPTHSEVNISTMDDMRNQSTTGTHEDSVTHESLEQDSLHLSEKDNKGVGLVKEWRSQNMIKEYQDGVVSHVDFKFPELLHFLGETHTQSDEVTEQFLLLIDHMGNYSSLFRYLLIDAELEALIRRILAMQTNNIYLICLCEMCISLLEVV